MHLAVAFCRIKIPFQNHNLERWIKSHRLFAQLGRTIVRVSQYIFFSLNWYFSFLGWIKLPTFKVGYVGSGVYMHGKYVGTHGTFWGQSWHCVGPTADFFQKATNHQKHPNYWKIITRNIQFLRNLLFFNG